MTLEYELPGKAAIEMTYTILGPAISMRLQIQNAGSSSISAKARFLLDTQVGQNDGSPFFVDTLGLMHTEKSWEGMPFSSWAGYDRWPESRVIARGHFDTPPDRVMLRTGAKR